MSKLTTHYHCSQCGLEVDVDVESSNKEDVWLQAYPCGRCLEESYKTGFADGKAEASKDE